jgi:hypothetical protein
MGAGHPTLEQLEDQIRWYDQSSVDNQRRSTIAHSGPYAGVADGRALLADWIDGLISQEHAKLVSARQESVKKRGSGETQRD